MYYFILLLYKGMLTNDETKNYPNTLGSRAKNMQQSLGSAHKEKENTENQKGNTENQKKVQCKQEACELRKIYNNGQVSETLFMLPLQYMEKSRNFHDTCGGNEWDNEFNTSENDESSHDALSGCSNLTKIPVISAAAAKEEDKKVNKKDAAKLEREKLKADKEAANEARKLRNEELDSFDNIKKPNKWVELTSRTSLSKNGGGRRRTRRVKRRVSCRKKWARKKKGTRRKGKAQRKGKSKKKRNR